MALAKIVFASMTGNTEEIADIVADKLRDLGLDVDVDECTTVDASDFLEADIAIVATYTYGDGELPDEMMDFYEDLADLNLNGKIYGVVGSGDTFYDEFCKAVDDFDRVFVATGAEKGSECVSILPDAAGESWWWLLPPVPTPRCRSGRIGRNWEQIGRASCRERV